MAVDKSNLGASRFELEFSVANLVVDDPMLRSTLGADFASVPTADDIAGTRGNMLGDKVLDGEKYPRIRIVGTGPDDARRQASLDRQSRAARPHGRFDGADRSDDRGR